MATNLTDKQIVTTKPSDGSAVYFRTTEVNVVGADYVPPAESIPPPGDSETTNDIGVPRNIEVESQDVRIQPDGSAVVDVVLSFEPAENAESHEVRISKV